MLICACCIGKSVKIAFKKIKIIIKKKKKRENEREEEEQEVVVVGCVYV